MFIQSQTSHYYYPTVILSTCSSTYLRKISSKLPILGINKQPVGSKLSEHLPQIWALFRIYCSTCEISSVSSQRLWSHASLTLYVVQERKTPSKQHPVFPPQHPAEGTWTRLIHKLRGSWRVPCRKLCPRKEKTQWRKEAAAGKTAT